VRTTRYYFASDDPGLVDSGTPCAAINVRLASTDEEVLFVSSVGKDRLGAFKAGDRVVEVPELKGARMVGVRVEESRLKT
jgi:hypothetical protein